MPQEATLSESAVAVLRFEIKGWRPKDVSRRLPSYRQLAAAGIMEPVPGSEFEYRFTEEGMKDRQEILDREQERIDRERSEPPDAGHLSESARRLLRRLIGGERVQVDETNRPAYRELAARRIMIPLHTFVGGRDAAYRFTYWGWKRRFEFAEIACSKEPA